MGQKILYFCRVNFSIFQTLGLDLLDTTLSQIMHVLLHAEILITARQNYLSKSESANSAEKSPVK